MPDPGLPPSPAGGGRGYPALGPDAIVLNGLRFMGVHGVLPEEGRAQPFEVDLELWLDLGGAGRTDDLAATVDYGLLCQAVRAVIEGPRVSLLERLAEQVAEAALAVAGGRAQGTVVTVRKLRPPVPVELASAGVRVWRRVAAAKEGRPGGEGPTAPSAGHG